ncbi:MAG: S41 family peptidase [Porphyromonadaceae bacterium]|nr:S41 family peptidase [Porphyromonadaceae bacterium]
MKKKIFIWLPFVIAIALVVGIAVGYLYPRHNVVKHTSTGTSGNKISNLLGIIDAQYVDTVDINDLVEEAIPQIVNGLDPHSAYIPAKDLQLVNEELEGSFSGVGIQFSIQNDTIMVIAVVPGGPSEKIGLMPGDRIVEVDDTAFVGKNVISNDKVLKKLRGEKGSRVKLGVLRSTSPEMLTYEVVRDDIPVNSVDVAFMVNTEIGYIKINKFGRTTYAEFLNGLAQLKNKNAKKYIIDLRSNSGGILEVAINMINEFLPKNQLIVYTEGKAFPRSEAVSNGSGAFKEEQMVVLIDEWSASASEIFAGAIQDNDRGVIIGRRSFGKGLVQNQLSFADGSAIRLTIARYYTPSGRSIQKEYELGHGEEYEKDILNRFMHGEFDNPDSIKQNDSQIYTTRLGRTVYGGGGIMPDIFVPRDTVGVTTYLNTVINKGIIYQYAFKYSDENRTLLSAFKDYKELQNYLEQQPLIREFATFAAAQGVKRNSEEIRESQELLTNYIESYIARNILGDNAFYPILLQEDKTFLKAVEILDKDGGFPTLGE